MNTPQFIPRKSYTIAYKLQVIDYALLHSISPAAQLFHLHHSMIYRWIPKREEMMMRLACVRYFIMLSLPLSLEPPSRFDNCFWYRFQVKLRTHT